LRVLVKILLVLLALYAGLLVFVYFYQSHLIFYPEPLDRNRKLSFPGNFSENILALGSGESIHFLEFRSPSPKQVILYFHGNAGNLASWGELASQISERTNSDVWIMDYPGFGKSSPRLPKNEKVLLEMGRALIERIRDARPGLPLYLYGRSIGSGVASALARSEKVEGLILEAPYTSLRALAKRLYPLVPGFVLRFDLDNTRLADSPEPRELLIIHGTDDEIIPFSFGETLALRLAERTQFMTIQGGHHNDLAEFPEYWGRLQAFFLSRPQP